MVSVLWTEAAAKEPLVWGGREPIVALDRVRGHPSAVSSQAHAVTCPTTRMGLVRDILTFPFTPHGVASFQAYLLFGFYMLPALVKEKLPDITASIVSLAVPSLLAFVGYSTCYLYELGYCIHFGIPRELIAFGIRDVAISLTCMLSALCVTVMLCATLASLQMASWTREVLPQNNGLGIALVGFAILYKGLFFFVIGWAAAFTFILITVIAIADAWRSNHKSRTVITALYSGALLLSLVLALRHGDLALAVGLVTMPLVAAILVKIASIRFPNPKPAGNTNWSKLSARKVFMPATGLLLFLLVGAFGFGLGAARNRTTFLVEEGSTDEVVVAIYGETAVLCQYETNEKTKSHGLTDRIRIRPITETGKQILTWTELGIIESGAVTSLPPYLQ